MYPTVTIPEYDTHQPELNEAQMISYYNELGLEEKTVEWLTEVINVYRKS